MSDSRLKAVHPDGEWKMRPFHHLGTYYAVAPDGTLVCLAHDGEIREITETWSRCTGLSWTLPEPVYEYRAEGLDPEGSAKHFRWRDSLEKAREVADRYNIFHVVFRRRESGDENLDNWIIVENGDD